MTQVENPGSVRRILVVTNMWPTDAAPMGGIFVAEQVASLRRAGLEVDVLFVDGAAGGYGAYLRGFGRVRRALRENQYDLVHAHYVFSGIMALAGRLLAFGLFSASRMPVVLTQHGIETQVGWTAPLCRWASRRVDATVATSTRVRDALGASISGEDGVVIPCGVDLALFQPCGRGEARRELGLPLEATVVLFAGMRRPEKRLDLVEAAVEQVRQQRPDVRLVIADNVPHVRMPLYMNAADVLVLASEAEGSPMVIKEALACNLPVVSVNVGDVAELIGSLRGCLIVERSVQALADGLLTVLTRGERVDGRRSVEQLALPAIAERLKLLYQNVYERAHRGFSSSIQTGSRQSSLR